MWVDDEKEKPKLYIKGLNSRIINKNILQELLTTINSNFFVSL